MSTVQVWGEVVLEMPWHVETSLKIFFFFFWLSENEIFFSAKRKGRFYSYFPDPPSINATFLSLDFSFTLPLFIASQKCIESTRNDAFQSVLSCHLPGV
jgi:hypothetical protein